MESWLSLFERSIRKYRCRYVEQIDPSDTDICISGPGGWWLSEIVSVAFDVRGALSNQVVQKLHDFYTRKFDTVSTVDETSTSQSSSPPLLLLLPSLPQSLPLITLDWFATDNDDSRGTSRNDKRKQCLVRFDLNNRIICVIVTNNEADRNRDNTTSSDRLQPFALIFAIECIYRKLPYRTYDSHCALIVDSEEELEPLNTICVTYECGRWIKIVKFDEEQNYIDVHRSANGYLRLAWREKNGSRDSALCHSLPNGSVFSLTDLDREITNARLPRKLLALCDFSIFLKRCQHALYNGENFSPRYRRSSNASSYNDTSFPFASFRLSCPFADHTTDETRYLIDREGNLVRRKFIELSS